MQTFPSVATVSGNIDNGGALLGRELLMVSSGADFNQSGVGMVQTLNSPSRVIVQAQRDLNFSSNAQIATTAPGGQVALSAEC